MLKLALAVGTKMVRERSALPPLPLVAVLVVVVVVLCETLLSLQALRLTHSFIARNAKEQE